MRSSVVIAVLCTVFGAGVFSQQPAVVAITGATLIDGNGGPPTSDAIVVVAGDRITAAGPRATTTVPAGATIIDARGKFLMPGLVLSIEAGIDLIQHPELLGLRELPDPLVRTIVGKKVICSMLSNTISGEAWKKAVKDRDEAQAKRAEAEKAQKGTPRPRTGAELRQRAADEGLELQMRRRNAQKLIAAGAVVTIGTDNYWAAAPEFTRGGAKPDNQNHGIGSVIAAEGLVELGMTPAQAIVAATRNGALAARGLSEFGTIEAGKRADLLLLDASPLSDISNLRRLSVVMRDGKVIDRDPLPLQRVLSR